MPCQGQVRHACVHRRATSRVKAKKRRKGAGGGEEKRKELAEEGKKEGAMLGRSVEGNTD